MADTDDELDLEREREEEDAAREEELELTAAAERDAETAERLADERTAQDELELDQLVADRAELAATADATRAIELAEADRSTSNQYRDLAVRDQQRATEDLAHGQHLLDDAAANPDAVDAPGKAAAGRRAERTSALEDELAEAEHHRADWYAAADRDHRRDARPEQPHPVEAVRRPPQNPPEGQTPQNRRQAQKRLQGKRPLAPDPIVPDLSMDRRPST
jgi:hypothetical protein